jgi:hypothetical protein
VAASFKSGRDTALALIAEARRMVDWYRAIAEECANTIQGLVARFPRGHRPDHVKAQIVELQRAEARAYLQIERYRKQAERYERYAGVGPSNTAIGVPA